MQVCTSLQTDNHANSEFQINLTVHYVINKKPVIKKMTKPYHKVIESTYHQALAAAIQYYTINCSNFSSYVTY